MPDGSWYPIEGRRRRVGDAALAGGRAPASDGREGVRAIEVFEAVDRSVGDQRPVYLAGDSKR